jgi:hypothetical protein
MPYKNRSSNNITAIAAADSAKTLNNNSQV